jgi:hypothetical protein
LRNRSTGGTGLGLAWHWASLNGSTTVASKSTVRPVEALDSRFAFRESMRGRFNHRNCRTLDHEFIRDIVREHRANTCIRIVVF